MQSLEVISVNLWQILISLCNLLILFWILKRFLYKPVKKMMEARKQEIDLQYAQAQEAQQEAYKTRSDWEDKMAHARQDADDILKDATEKAKKRSDNILTDAKRQADGILLQAKSEAEQEMKKAEATIRHQIIDVSSSLTEKLLEREINPEDHRAFIDTFIDSIGEDNGSNS